VLGPLLAAMLAACQSSELPPPGAAAGSGWRVVERTGEVRLHGPGTGTWAPVMAGVEIDGASRVATGAGGRLILARPGVQIAAGTGSTFVLADPDARPLRQEAGRLRYRVDRAVDDPFVVETPFMRVQTRSAVFDLAIGPDGGEVTVETGRLLVMTSDGARGATLEAGQVAYSRTVPSEQLMVRQGAGEAAAPADPYVVNVAPHTATASVHAVARAKLPPLPTALAPEPAALPAAVPPVAIPALQLMPASEQPVQTVLPAGYQESPPSRPETTSVEKQVEARADDAKAAPPPEAAADDTKLAPPPKPDAAIVDGRGAGIARLTDGLVQALAPAPAPGAPRASRSNAL
jgi:hypothetical protein